MTKNLYRFTTRTLPLSRALVDPRVNVGDFNYPWDLVKRSVFIEDLMLYCPFPAIYLGTDRSLNLYNEEETSYRLATLIDYELGVFRLSGLEILPEFNGMKSQELPRGIQRRIRESEVTIVTKVLL